MSDAQKLKHLAVVCDGAAQKAKSSGARWLEEALELTLTAEGVQSPIRYVESILRAWIKHGKGADLRPTREGYRPPRKAPKQSAQQRQQQPDVCAKRCWARRGPWRRERDDTREVLAELGLDGASPL